MQLFDLACHVSGTNAFISSASHEVLCKDGSWDLRCILSSATRLSSVWYRPRQWGFSSVWLSIVVCLLAALTALAPLAMTFADPWGDIFEERNADSFVDDTSNGCNDAHLEMAMPFAELIAHGQACAQIWEQILYSSGGALELKKCFWYLVLLAMGERTSSDGSKYFLSWNYCTNLWKCP